MANPGAIMFFHLLISIFMLSLSLSKCTAIENDDRKEYIVYMGSLPEDGLYSPTANHISLLQGVLQGSNIEKSLVRSYKRSFNGFAAKLTDTEKQKIAEMKGVISVFPNRNYQLHTTRSWDFIGLNEITKRNLTIESDIIMGVLDTGVWPESHSFSDEGFGPPPKKWKGACKGGSDFKCNKKIIGARNYAVNETARDIDGHGSHTASTAAGNHVNGISFFGIAEGTAKGGVPSARLAVYKVCSAVDCPSSSILAAFDDAIADGVDIISISLGFNSLLHYDEDPIAIGAFHGLKKGVLTINSAGNGGPTVASIKSLAPWMMTVAASSTDRQIISKVVLGNGKTLVGNTVNSFTLNGTSFPLIYGKAAANNFCAAEDASACICINDTAVKGKILLCDFLFETDSFNHGVGIINKKVVSPDTPFVDPVPSSGLRVEDYDVVKSYFNSTENPHGLILKSEVIKDSTAPRVASFSSRGSNLLTPDILKPDITAPGVDILAAYSPLVSPSSYSYDARRVNYSIVSGTSMACPHVAGAAAYVKSFHPDWSPSALKSSLMTTASAMDIIESLNQNEYGFGAGHINPVEAIDPGLVYESFEEDYINFLCGIGYTKEKIKLVSGENSTCPKVSPQPKDLNYPSLSHQVIQSNGSFTIDFHRRVKNVGIANSTYRVKVISNNNILDVKVVPEVLSFKSLNEEKTFNVTVKGDQVLGAGTTASSSIVWSDGTHSVKSPIVILFSI
ncbi:subtilisin-like protease SBT4.13 [Ziziphus jujuba]|uniref:Subtilisin-like protease SBT4.13 n=1 Tax=Ziziphus jujuba TaxID=326968 RepID=A0ABM3IAW3_ZIZJJ|nr:subtilisin-like protease SBT4.13 [Ziziphus jujuba]